MAKWLGVLEPLPDADRLAPLNRWATELGLVNALGRDIRFVAAEESESVHAVRPSTCTGAMAYESRIFHTGEVPTRTSGSGARHDLYNALAWLAWPRSKARLNALHLSAGSVSAGVGARGAVRDAATLFDENAVVWVAQDERLEAALRGFQWHELFIANREALSSRVQVAVFGHALMHKLDAPYKAITAHAWPMCLPAGACAEDIDRSLAATLTPERLHARTLCPLPVMGLPGWCAANQDPAFYDDPAVFRSGRRRRTATTDQANPVDFETISSGPNAQCRHDCAGTLIHSQDHSPKLMRTESS